MKEKIVNFYNKAKEYLTKNKRNSFIAIFVVALVLVSVLALANTKAEEDILTNGVVVRWSFKENGSSAGISFSLANTVDQDTLKNGKIVIGSTGSFSLDLSNLDITDGVDYKIVLSYKNAPDNLKLYSDANRKTELNKDEDSYILEGNIFELNSIQEIKVFYEWDDGTDKKEYNPNEVTLLATIIQIQK